MSSLIVSADQDSSASPGVQSRRSGTRLRSATRTRRIVMALTLTVATPMRGSWPRGRMKARVSKAMRGSRFGMAMPTVVSWRRFWRSSPGRPARRISRVVAPQGRPATQSRSPSRSTARDGIGGSARIQSPGFQSVRRAGGLVKVRQARAGSASASGRDAADQHAGGAARGFQALAVFRVVGAFEDGLQRLDLLHRAVHAARATSAITSRGAISGSP